MRLFSHLIISSILAGAIDSAAASNHIAEPAIAAPRTSITIFRYHGVNPGTGSDAQFGMFVGLIEHKFANLRDHLANELEQGSESSVVKYIDTISIQKKLDEEAPSSNALIQEWMRAEIDLLQILRGTLFKPSQGDPSLMTLSHFVEDPGNGKMRNFSIKLKLTEDEYANTRDSHSLVILYSIATEAKRMGVARSQLAVIVAFAMNAIADLERRTGPLAGEMLALKNAWQEFKNAL